MTDTQILQPPGPQGTFNPATFEPLPEVTPTPVEEVAAVVQRAREAQRGWATTPLEQRAEKALALGRAVVERRKEIAVIAASETGRCETEALVNEIASTISYARSAIRAARKALAPEKIKLPSMDLPGKKVVVEAVPRGVIGIIAPWNYPLSNFFKSMFPALLAGDAVVLKPSSCTPRTGAWLAELCGEFFPADLVGLVQGGGAVAEALIGGGIDGVVFTGSVPTGRRVAMKAAELLIPCSVELGGKDAAVVLADCALDRTVAGIAQWSMHNCGQNCAGIERVYVEEAIADEFVQRLGAYVGALRVAPQDDGFADLGPVQNEGQLRIVEEHVAEALEQGAALVCGGQRTGQGLGYLPTVLDRCEATMRIVHEETFGPVVAVVRVPDADEAMRQANDIRYGLNASVWTADLARGAALARRFEAGVCYVNNHAFAGTLPEIPWTGVKETGPGVAASRHSYPVFVRRQTVFVDSNRDPDPWWMPIDADLAAFADALATKELGSLTVLLRLLGLLKKRVATIRSFGQG